MARQILDLSHRVEHGMVTYPGLPTPVIRDHLSFEGSRSHYDAGTEFQIGAIEMVANTGTYLDVPAHRYPDGYGLVDLPLHRVVDVPAVVVDAPGPAIEAATLGGVELRGRAALFRTGWSRFWGSGTYGGAGHPFLTAAAAEELVRQEPALVGIDSLNVDSTSVGERPAHSLLLGAGIPIIEHLTNLEQLPAGVGVRLTALPVAVVGLGSFPTRVVALWEDDPAEAPTMERG
jgi:arylformamidase